MEPNEKDQVKTFVISINPLTFHNIDEAFAKTGYHHDPSPEALLKNMCPPGADTSLETMKVRYKEITESETVKLLYAPVEEPRILDRMIWPLRYAKTCYIIGNYTGTIALCGMVAEMVAILTFEMSEIKFNNQPMSEEVQGKIFGRTFEKLGQYQRINVLEGFGFIGEELKQQFETIRLKRKKYLHLWSEEQENVEEDARTVFGAAVHLVAKTIGQEIVDRRMLKLNPAFEKYLDKQGLIQTHTNED